MAPAVEASVGQEAAAPQRASAARSNQVMQGRLPAAPPDCALGDEACGLDVTLDEVLGEGAQEDVDALMSDITRHVGRVAARLSELRDPELEATYCRHADGALNLNGLLNDKGVALLASAERDESGELTWSALLEVQVLVVQGRAEAAIEVLTAVEQLLDAKSVEPLLAGLAVFAQIGAGALDGLRIRSESGYRQLELLCTLFEDRKESFEANRNAVLKQSASMLMGPLDKTLKAKGNLKRVWTLGNALLAVTTEPKSPWATVKAVKSVGFAAVSEYTRLLAGTDPFAMAWGELAMLVNTCQLIVDLGPTVKDYALMVDLAEHARAVRDQYGADMAFYQENKEAIAAQAEGLAKFAAAAATVDAQMTAAEATIAGAGAAAPDFYAPFN
ncbi:MAG: hypothetical protein V4850_24275 [Myxococcota bacterium]